jgi:hypothetical protein
MFWRQLPLLGLFFDIIMRLEETARGGASTNSPRRIIASRPSTPSAIISKQWTAGGIKHGILGKGELIEMDHSDAYVSS